MKKKWVYSDKRCYFCDERFRVEPPAEDDMFVDEVGEFWSERLQDSVLAHPDCLPLGIEAVFNGTDPEWQMA